MNRINSLCLAAGLSLSASGSVYAGAGNDNPVPFSPIPEVGGMNDYAPNQDPIIPVDGEFTNPEGNLTTTLLSNGRMSGALLKASSSFASVSGANVISITGAQLLNTTGGDSFHGNVKLEFVGMTEGCQIEYQIKYSSLPGAYGLPPTVEEHYVADHVGSSMGHNNIGLETGLEMHYSGNFIAGDDTALTYLIFRPSRYEQAATMFLDVLEAKATQHCHDIEPYIGNTGDVVWDIVDDDVSTANP